MTTADETPAVFEPRSTGDDISIARLLVMIWQRRAIFLVGFLLPIILALIYLHVATYKYRAELGLAPPQTASGGSAGALGGNLGGLAALAGVNVGSQSGGLNFQLYKDALYERETAVELVAEPWLMHGVFYSEWNAESRSWRQPTGIVPSAKHLVFAILGTPDEEWSIPDAARLQEFIAKNVSVSTSTKSPVMRLSMMHRDAHFAVRFLDATHAVIDSGLRHRLLNRTTQNIRYLSDQLARTQLAEHRQALATMLGEQERLRMTASSTVAFAAEPLSAASATRLPETPNGPIVMAIAVVAGVAFGTAAALGVTALKRFRG